MVEDDVIKSIVNVENILSNIEKGIQNLQEENLQLREKLREYKSNFNNIKAMLDAMEHKVNTLLINSKNKIEEQTNEINKLKQILQQKTN
jgi:predicted RNase H-like nuclease (RuvC/YqgF family)